MERPALVPELYVSDLEESLKFYVGFLGFRVAYTRPGERFAAIHLGAAHIMLEEAPSLQISTSEEFASGQWRTADLERPFGRGVNFEIEVSGIEEVSCRLDGQGYPLLLNLHERSYRVCGSDVRVRQLLVADPDGYLVRLSQRCS